MSSRPVPHNDTKPLYNNQVFSNLSLRARAVHGTTTEGFFFFVFYDKIDEYEKIYIYVWSPISFKKKKSKFLTTPLRLGRFWPKLF